MADCEQVRDQYLSYALGALEGAQRVEIERHLARNCPVCTAGVAEARWLVSQLSHLAPNAAPPDALRQRILAETKQPAGPRPIPLRSWIPAWAWAVAATLVAMTTFSVYQNRRADRDLAALRQQLLAAEVQGQQLQTERAHYVMATEILMAQDAKPVKLMPTKPDMPMFHAVCSQKMGLLLMAHDVPQLPSSMTLQLWAIDKQGKPLSMGMFRPDQAGQAMMVMPMGANLNEIAALAISEEPSGGSLQPTGAVLWKGPLS
ncbi:MAG: anti-sigma factor domain-containing protein [Candidatus Acidiferrales bacterium]